MNADNRIHDTGQNGYVQFQVFSITSTISQSKLMSGSFAAAS